jgi:hypothetical protein
MGINFDQIKSKLSSLTKKNTRALWKPAQGKQVVRIVPYKHNPEFPFTELFFHYGLDGKTYLSPKTFGRPDPVIEYADKLKKSGDDVLFQKGRELTPKKRTYAPVLVRGQEKEGVRFWGFGKEVYEEILAILDDGEFGDITDPVKGYDLTVEHKSAAELNANFPKTFIRPKAKSTPILDDPVDPALLRRIVEDQQDILQMWPEPTYDQLSEALYRHLNPEKADDAAAETAEESSGIDENVEPPASALVNPPTAEATPAEAPVAAKPASVASPSAEASKKGQNFNDVFAAFDSVLKKKV